MKTAQKTANNYTNRKAADTRQSGQNPLAQIDVNRPEAIAQKELMGSMHSSPRMVAQRRQLEGYSQGNFLEQDTAQLKQESAPITNNTGLPDNLKSGIESLSGISMDNVKVHYNSSEPANLNAFAYAQGTDIHIATGQEKHLPHEAWHVVQQAQGRVRPTMQMKSGISINDEHSLEQEANEMGKLSKTNAELGYDTVGKRSINRTTAGVVQCVRGAGLHHLGPAPTGKAGGSAIQIKFFKVSNIYNTINLTRPSDGIPLNCSPSVGGFVDVPPNITANKLGTATTQVTPGGQLQVEIGGVMLPGDYHLPFLTQRVACPARKREAVFKAVLAHNGYHWPGFAPDHIIDLTLRGVDEFSNLWPLDSATNLRANKTWIQPILVGHGDGLTKHKKMLLNRLPNKKYVKIVSLHNP
jgi:Domain of unknown function (DUF4157)